MDFYWLILGVLAVWRVTHLFNAEDGPWDVMARLRNAVGSGFTGKLLDCFHCLSLWVAAPPALLLARGWKERVFLWLSCSGGAILLEKLTSRESASVPATYFEHGENYIVVLRKAEEPLSNERPEHPVD